MAGLLDYIPSDKYIRKGWKPEQIDESTLANLAKAQALAQKVGLLSPNLANQMLPNALVEGWSNYGVVDNKLGYPPNKRRDDAFEKMGMTVANSDAPQVIKNWSHVLRDTKEGYWLPQVTHSQQNAAKLAAITLAEKAKLYGEDKAIERWNGRGRAIEDVDGSLVQADSANHARKVAEMARLLQHPSNAKLMNMYKGLLGD